jgi:hypothetical protein
MLVWVLVVVVVVVAMKLLLPTFTGGGVNPFCLVTVAV